MKNRNRDMKNRNRDMEYRNRDTITETTIVLNPLSSNSQEVVRATAVAMDYWMKFRKDVVVDLVCFRRW